MSDSVVPAAPPDHTSGFAAKLLVLGLRASLAVSPRPTAWALRHLFAKSAAERGARQLTDAPADIAAVIDEPYDPNPDALLDMYMPGEAARSGTARPAVAQTHGGAFAGGSKDEIGGCSWLRSSSASRGRTARPAPQWHHRGAFGGEVPRPGPRRRRRWSPAALPVLEHRAGAVIVGGIGAGPGLDLGGQRGQVAQVLPAARGGDQDRIGSVPAVPGSWPVQPQMVQASGRGTRAGPRRPALRRPGVSAGQLDLRHLAHLAGVA